MKHVRSNEKSIFDNVDILKFQQLDQATEKYCLKLFYTGFHPDPQKLEQVNHLVRCTLYSHAPRGSIAHFSYECWNFKISSTNLKFRTTL